MDKNIRFDQGGGDEGGAADDDDAAPDGDTDNGEPDDTDDNNEKDGNDQSDPGVPDTTTDGPLPKGDAGTTVETAPDNVSTTAATSEDANPSSILPPDHEIDRWYQNIDGKWVLTNTTDARNLGNGEFVMEGSDGVTSIHFSSGPTQDAGQPTPPPPPDPPDDPQMTGYVAAWPQGPADVAGIPGGSVNPNTWVYEYDSVEELPDFLKPAENWDGDSWTVPSKDGSPLYTVYLQPDKSVIVWRTGH